MMKWMRVHRITTDSLFKEPQQVLIARLQTATDYLLSEPMSFKKQAIVYEDGRRTGCREKKKQ